MKQKCKFRKFIAMLLVSILSMISVSNANASFSVCNDSDKDIMIVYAVSSGLQLISDTWDVNGWIKIGPGCHRVNRGYALTHSFIRIMKKKGSGWELLDTNKIKVNEIKPNIWKKRATMVKTERRFCISNKPMNSKGIPWKKLLNETCPSGSKKGKFQLFINVPPTGASAEIVVSNRGIRLSAR